MQPVAQDITWGGLRVDLLRPFRVAHGISSHRTNVWVQVRGGWGEGAIVPYYAETLASVQAWISEAASRFRHLHPEQLENNLRHLPEGSMSGRCALDIALHDLHAKSLGKPLYQVLGLDPSRTPQSCVTIALDETAAMAQLARETALPILKIKLGDPARDVEIVRAIRNACSSKLRVDANAGWTREQARQIIPALLEIGVELIEQPLAKEDREGLKSLRREFGAAAPGGAPIYADESFQSAQDLDELAHCVDGVVIKLMKAGGIHGALTQITSARAHGLRVMLSCMVESALASTAAAHIASLADEVDLDSSFLVKDDPFTGMRLDGARVVLPTGPGLGVEPSPHFISHSFPSG